MINISFDMFDTACYNLRYNIMQLIKNTVGISIEINTMGSQLENIQQSVTDIEDNIGNVDLRDLRNAVRDLRTDVDNLMSGGSGDLQEIDRRLDQLEVNGLFMQAQIDRLNKEVFP